MIKKRYRQAQVILNPSAGSGKARSRWARLEPLVRAKLGPVEAQFTQAPNHAIELTRQALRKGADLVIGIGGDGTFNEIVNGYFEAGRPVSPDASLALCPLGTGGDFRRSAGIPRSLEEAVTAIAEEPVRRVDACRIALATANGGTVERYFANVASFGMGGSVSMSAKNNFLTPISGRAAFLWATVTTLVGFRPKTVHLVLDDTQKIHTRFLQVAIGNGSFHGGGMHVCPLARLDSGYMEITTIGNIGLIEFLWSLPLLYSGRIYASPKCTHFRAKRIEAASPESVLAEVDGEAVGQLPASAEVLAGAILLAGTQSS